MNYSRPPAISILMTVFNAEPYLGFAIDSIERQTFEDWEFIIVDDASTDRSLAIAEAYAKKDPRIKIIRNAINKGQTRCLNQGLSEARGAWIARQDADDLSHPARLQRQWKRVQEEPTLVLLGTSGSMIDKMGKLIGLLDMPLTHDLIRWSAPIKNPFLHTSVMFRTDIAQSLGGYDERYHIAQDYDLWTRMIRNHRVANLSERLISYRHLDSSLSKLGAMKTFAEANEIAIREEKYSFAQELKPEERLLLQNFREGKSVHWEELLQFCKNFQKPFPLIAQNDRQRLEVVYRLQCAGSKNQNRYDQLRAITQAFLTSPLYTLQWIGSRLFDPIHQKK